MNNIKHVLSLSFLILLTITVLGQSNDSLVIRKIFNEALSNGNGYELLAHLSNKIGARLSCSPQAAIAVEWSKKVMQDLNFDTVYLQEVMVPCWVRGEKEFAKITDSKNTTHKEVSICALGGSIGTAPNGITAKVVEVHTFEELEKLGKSGIEGKIVFYNRPMNPTYISTFSAYGDAVDQRWKGAMEGAKYEAVGVIVRSMTLSQDDYPHTGSMGYKDTIKKIPAAAISTNGADMLSNMLKQDPELMFHFKMNCTTLPDVKSYNVIGEIKGTEHPEEIIIAGGHLDSWDLGSGAHDDGAGCIHSIEALYLIKSLGIKPKRTIRAVLFMNEENGLRGAKKYAELAKLNQEKHIAAIESDGGGATPQGFSIESEKDKIDKIVRWKHLFEPYGIYKISEGHSGADISTLKGQNVILIGLSPDPQRYFDYHHANTDTFDKINKRELELGSAAIASLVYLLSEYGINE